MRALVVRLLCAGIIAACAACATTAAGPPQRLLVIGASARSSQQLIPQALARGYEVVAVTRNPADVPATDPRLRVVRGDVYDRASLEAVMTGREVVISMVGPRVDPLQEVPPMDLFTTGTGNIIRAMQARGNRRLLVASSIGVENEFPTAKPADVQQPGKLWLWNSRNLYKDMRAMEDLVRASGLDYVIFRPGFMVEEPARHDLRFAVNQASPKQRMITYADFAGFVLDQVASDQYLGATVGVYSDRLLQFGQNADFGKLSQEMQDRARRQQPQP